MDFNKLLNDFLVKLRIRNGEEEIKGIAFLKEGHGYIPRKIRVNSNGKITHFVLLPETDVYASCQWTRNTASVCRTMSKTDKLMHIWKAVCDRETQVYSYDYGDDWRFPAETINLHSGDCEDGTILFITACKDAGLSENEVFNACGMTNFGYHSYPIAWLSTDDAKAMGFEKAGWYIFETTINQVSKPKPLIGSIYHVDTLQNWINVGKINEGYGAEFNG